MRLTDDKQAGKAQSVTEHEVVLVTCPLTRRLQTPMSTGLGAESRTEMKNMAIEQNDE